MEIDGGIHEYTKEYDKERERLLKRGGFHILRFKNEMIIHNLPEVLKSILDAYIKFSTNDQGN